MQQYTQYVIYEMKYIFLESLNDKTNIYLGYFFIYLL